MDKPGRAATVLRLLMKKDLVASVLVVVLLLSAISAATLSIQFVRLSSQARGLQAQIDNLNRTRTVIQSLANDALEYSKQNPAIDPILFQFGVKQRPAAPAPAPAPAPSPKTRK